MGEDVASSDVTPHVKECIIIRKLYNLRLNEPNVNITLKSQGMIKYFER